MTHDVSYEIFRREWNSIFKVLKENKIVKHPRDPSIGEWMKNEWYIYTLKYNSAIKRELQ